MNKEFRLAVVGAGRIGLVHAENLAQRVRNVELVAATTSDSERAAEVKRRCGDVAVFPALADLLAAGPELDGVVIATSPKVSLSVAQECKELGVDRVWFHKNFGAGSYSREAHDYCKQNGITALVSCPLWYGQTSDGFHKFLGAACRVLRQVPNTIE